MSSLRAVSRMIGSWSVRRIRRHLEAVDSWQHHVQNDQIRPLFAQQLEAILAGGGGGDTVPLARQ